MEKIIFWRAMSLIGILLGVLAVFLFGHRIGGPLAGISAISYLFLSAVTNFIRVRFRFEKGILPVKFFEATSVSGKIRTNAGLVILAIVVASVYFPTIIEIFVGSFFFLFSWAISFFAFIFFFVFLCLPATEKWAIKIGKKIRDKDEIKKREKNTPLRKV